MSIRGLQVPMVGALAAAASAVIAAPAFAQTHDSLRPTGDPHVMKSPDGTLSMEVRYAKNDLNSDSGAHKVYRQLRAAAQTVCNDNGSVEHDLTIRHAMDQCEKSAIEGAVDRIDSQKLNALYVQNAP